MSDDIQVFKAVGAASEKQMILQRVLAEEESIFIKDKFDRSIELKPISLNSNMQIKCHHPEDFALQVSEGEIFTASFTLGSERFIFETHPVISDSHITLSLLYLFHLQRRKHFRYLLPQDYSAEFIINYLNQNVCAHTCRLLDLSVEGCGIEFESYNNEFKLDDVVHAEIFLGDRDPIVIQGLIKNIRMKNDSAILGVEFNHMASASESKIVIALTDFQREIFVRNSA